MKNKIKNIEGILKTIQDKDGLYLQFIPYSIEDTKKISPQEFINSIKKPFNSLFIDTPHPTAAGITIKVDTQNLIDNLSLKERKINESEDDTDVFYALTSQLLKQHKIDNDEIKALGDWKNKGGNIKKINDYLRKKF